MHRRVVRPYGSSIPATRALSLLMGLIVLWMLFDRSRDPATWRFLASAPEMNEEDTFAEAPPEKAPEKTLEKVPDTPLAEVVVPGPNDLDPEALEKFATLQELISDRTPLRSREMLPYWKLMEWSRTQTTRELEKRAIPEPAFTQIWEQPANYRGKLLRLRMHVRRVLKYDAPADNPLGLKVAYEAWGWSDESKSFPYVVVFSERPAGLPVGNDIQSEIVFAGYFMKIMSYTAFDSTRGAPLLIGRVRLAKPVAGRNSQEGSPLSATLGVIVLVVVLAGVVGWWGLKSTGRKPVAIRTQHRSDLDADTILGLAGATTGDAGGERSFDLQVAREAPPAAVNAAPEPVSVPASDDSHRDPGGAA